MYTQSAELNIPYQGVWLAGVDEVGRGPLVGNVVAAAVILDPKRPILGLADSKKLSAKRREQLTEEIEQTALAYALGQADSFEIDQMNILQATFLAMQRAVKALPTLAEYVLVDGNRLPELACPAQAIIQGDARHPAISAASIIAKVARDAQMRELDRIYPHYGFAQHKGYPTAQHLKALMTYGPIAAHRRSFAPVRRCLEAFKKVSIFN